MDESEDNEGKEAGAKSSVSEVSNEVEASSLNSDQNHPENKDGDDADEPPGEQKEEKEEKEEESTLDQENDPNNDAEASQQREDIDGEGTTTHSLEAKEESMLDQENDPNNGAGPSQLGQDNDGEGTHQVGDGPKVDQDLGGEADGDGTGTTAEKETENIDNQNQKEDGIQDEDVCKVEAMDDGKTNETPKDESGMDTKENEKSSELEEPGEIEMEDISSCPEDGEIVEECQASTSKDVSISKGDDPLDETVTKEDAVEVKTFEEAKERIVVLERRIEAEVKQRSDLTKQVKSLSMELHKLKGVGSLETQTVGVQTEPECIQIYDEQPPPQQAEVYQVVDSSRSAQPGGSTGQGPAQWPARNAGQASSSSQGQSIAESVRATAEAALAQSGVVLDEASGMYYDYNSGYYYDPNNYLYYDPARGIYYYYDEQTQSYVYHSKIDLPEVVVTGTGNTRVLPDGRRQGRDRRKDGRSRRRKDHHTERKDEQSGTSERPSTSRIKPSNMDCEVIDITSPAEDYPENGTDMTTTATTTTAPSTTTTSTTTTTTTTKSQEASPDQNDDRADVFEIMDDDDTSRRHHRRWSKSSSTSRRKRRKTGGEDERKENGEELPDVIVIDSDESDMEEGELSDSSLESRGSSKGESGDDAEGEDVSEESMVIDDDDDVQTIEATKVDYPPCIRMIVVRSESMKLGSLSIVTCTGGTVGREGSSHILLVPELGVSKTHAQMSYDTERRGYTITDLGSQNGTVLNGVPLTRKSRVKSDPQPLSHKDYLTFGTTTLRIHIHRGDETCDECEPGQVQAAFRQQSKSMEVTPVLSQADKEQQRRKELRKIKKKYLLVGADYSQREPSRGHPGYKDRAEERRVTVGSDNPYQPNDEPASVDRAISGSNMGHKMLRKMGWKEGQSLGKNDSGIKEPIQVFIHSKKSGLGAGSQKSMDSLDVLGKRKSENWERARDRYHQADQQGTSSSSRQSRRSLELKWVKGTTQVDEAQNSSHQKEDEDEDVCEVVAMEDGETKRDGVAKETVNNVCEVDMEEGEKKEDGDENRLDSQSGEMSSKNCEVVEEKIMETAEKAPSVVGNDSKSRTSPTNNGAASKDVTENQNISLESESTFKSNLQNEADGTNAEQTHSESKNSKADGQEPSTSNNLQRSKDQQNSVEVPVEREAAKKPIKFVIPPRMNSKGDSGKTPLTASRSVTENNGEAPSMRRTRQSSRRGKDKREEIDMFENG